MMKKWELALLTGLILAVVLSQFSTFSATCDAVRDDTLRLHILANSDKKTDQNAKLRVRDALLLEYGNVFSAATDKETAKILAHQYASSMEKTAEKITGLPVAVKIERMYFSTKEYDSFTMPAGVYDAVRVEIGSAAGHNWFCVMYPPLCLPAASQDGLAIYTQQETDVLKSPYKIKFAAVEWLQKMKTASVQ